MKTMMFETNETDIVYVDNANICTEQKLRPLHKPPRKMPEVKKNISKIENSKKSKHFCDYIVSFRSYTSVP